MQNKDRKKMVTMMESYLQLKELTSANEKQLDALKGQIEELAVRYPDDWVAGVFAVEGVGSIKQMNNPPRLVLTATGLPLTEIETVGIIAELGDAYSKPTVNVAKLRDRVVRRDRAVLEVLARHGVVCESATRLDIKAK